MKVGALMMTLGAVTFAVIGGFAGYLFALVYGAAALDMWITCLGRYR